MRSMGNDAELLQELLSSGAEVSRLEDSALLHRLVESAPKSLRGRRQSTLFDALGVLNLENPHSDFIAWLLDPRGPLSGSWLLRALLDRVAPEQLWPGDDPVVEREVDVSGGRLDIRVTWDSFVLIIENKVWSPQGVNQITRYLLEIPSAADGRLIYLSPYGRLPKGVRDAGNRVVAFSYVDLKSLVLGNIDGEPHERGRVFANELCRCVDRLLKIRQDQMNKPQMSESTKIYLKETKRLSAIKALAVDESSDFLEWMYSEIERRLRPVLGEEIVTHRGRYVTVYRLPDWVIGKVQFGVMFSLSIDAKKKLFTEAREGPYAGAGCWQIDDGEGAQAYAECAEVSNRLLPEFTKAWPKKSDLQSDETMPLWREVPVPASVDLDTWAQEVVGFCEELATALCPTLKRIAAAALK